jgi:hypothetical protein
MSAVLSEDRPTFTTRPPHFPRKIALEEAVNTSVFNASRTTPPVPGTSDMEYATPDYGPTSNGGCLTPACRSSRWTGRRGAGRGLGDVARHRGNLRHPPGGRRGEEVQRRDPGSTSAVRYAALAVASALAAAATIAATVAPCTP